MVKQLFLIKPMKEEKYLKFFFSPQTEPDTAKLCFTNFEAFWGIFTENFYFLSKKWQKGTDTLRKFVFLNMFEKAQIPKKIWICLNNFLSNQWNGSYINKKCFSPQISHIQLNYVFLLFWSILGEIQREILFLVKKNISERRIDILTKFIFLNMFENGHILTKIWMCLNKSFDEPSKRWQILTKNAFLPKVSHIQLNYVFRLFWSIYGKFTENFPF